MLRPVFGVTLLAGLLWSAGGCAKVELPREINVGSGSSRERVDSTKIPHTQNHSEARQELRKAYHRIGRLERDNDRLRRQRDDYKDKYKHQKDKYEDLKDKYDD